MKSMALAGVLVCALAATANAAELGTKGAVSINGDFRLDLSSISNDRTDSSVTTITIAPHGDFFVASSLSLGGGIRVSYVSAGGDSDTSFGLQARFGYYLPLASIGLWPLIGFTFDEGPVDTVSLDLYVPLVFHLAPHFFLGLGPVLNQDVYADDGSDSNGDEAKFRRIGITSMIGGAW